MEGFRNAGYKNGGDAGDHQGWRANPRYPGMGGVPHPSKDPWAMVGSRRTRQKLANQTKWVAMVEYLQTASCALRVGTGVVGRLLGGPLASRAQALRSADKGTL